MGSGSSKECPTECPKCHYKFSNNEQVIVNGSNKPPTSESNKKLTNGSNKTLTNGSNKTLTNGSNDPKAPTSGGRKKTKNPKKIIKKIIKKTKNPKKIRKTKK